MKISLRKQIRMVLLDVYLFAIACALLAEVISVYSYQKQLKTERTKYAAEYTEELISRISELKMTVRQIFVNDPSVKKLRQYVNNTKNFDEIMTLKDDLWLSYTLSGCMRGLCVYYGGGTKRIYQLDALLDRYEREQVLAAWDMLGKNDGQGSSEMILNLEKNHYYIFEMDMASISVIGMVSLDWNTFMEKWDGQLGMFHTVSQNYEWFMGNHLEKTEKNVQSQSPESEEVKKLYQIYKGEIPDSAYQMICLYEKNLWSYVNIFHIVVLMMLCLSVYPANLVYRLIKNQILEPLQKMTDTMLRIQDGHFENFTTLGNIAEINEVNKSIEHMLKEVMSWKDRTYEAQIEAQTAELQYLQLQLRPHFYLNCLKRINGLVMARQYENIQDYIISVSMHFQCLMQKCTDFVSVHSEMEFVKNYLKMMGFDSVASVKAAENVWIERIPSLSIQSFVENSVKYSGKGKGELQIRICIERIMAEEGEFISIVVSDNGNGYQEEILRKLNQEIDVENCIGISNLKKRLKLLYEGQAMMYFENRNGAVSQLVLPLAERSTL